LASAAGCRNRRATTTSAITVITAGAIAARSDAPGGMIPSVFHCRTTAATIPYRRDPAITPIGRQAPKYTRATAMNPWPWVRFCWKIPSSSARVAPARPASVLPRITVEYRTRATPTPRLSAAAGFSPTARIFIP